MKLMDLTGRRFGRLVVVLRSANKGRHTQWECVCDCGQKVVAMQTNLCKERGTVSCGCGRAQASAARMKVIAKTHGLSRTRLYKTWDSMRGRCYRPKNASYKRYGARGIRVCTSWLKSFETFARWALSHGYADHLQIDRRNNDGNYTPGNCRFVTNLVNVRNRSCSRSRRADAHSS